MSALFHDLALLEDDDLVGISNSGETVRDNDACLLSHELVQCFLYLVLAFGIESACRLIQKNHLRLANESPGDGDPLLLAAGEPDTALAHETIETFGEQCHVLDKAKAVSHAAGLSQPLHNLILAGALKVDTVQDVVLDAAGEEDWLLLDESQLFLMIPCVVQVLQVGA